MANTMQKQFQALAQSHRENQNLKAFVTAGLVAALLMALPMQAMAQTFDIPFITTFGCNVVKWMKGPLAVLIFVVVVVATLVIGMISKMDWSRIISVCVVFGIVIGLGNVLAGSSFLQSMPSMQSCLLGY